MRRQFREKFGEIRREFDKVFKELFGGGTGTLELSQEEDILEAGIQIISQPPGKKLQNMMQLSGGEKALTAIALLFAIQNLKPSPFCLLDEIEAALDDSNVDRFAGYLHKLTRIHAVYRHHPPTRHDGVGRPPVWYHDAGERCVHAGIGQPDRGADGAGRGKSRIIIAKKSSEIEKEAQPWEIRKRVFSAVW